MRKEFFANASIAVQLDMPLLSSVQLSDTCLVLLPDKAFTQWIEKLNNVSLKLIDAFGFSIIHIIITIGALPIFQRAYPKRFCFGGKLSQGFSHFRNVIQRKFGHVERNMRKEVFGVQNKQVALLLQVLTNSNRFFRNLLGRIDNNIERFGFHKVLLQVPTVFGSLLIYFLRAEKFSAFLAAYEEATSTQQEVNSI